MKLGIFYNGTDSNYQRDANLNEHRISQNRFRYGEVVSRLGHYATTAFGADNVLRLNGVGDGDLEGGVTATVSTLTGLGMHADVMSIINFVKARTNRLQGSEKAKVLVAGWSRGGIGAIYAGHLLAKLHEGGQLPKVESIQIMAFDPVSGLGTNVRAINMPWDKFLLNVAAMTAAMTLATNSTNVIASEIAGEAFSNILNASGTKWWTLGSAVTDYAGFYAHDERSAGFSSTIPSMENSGNMKLRGVPGTHSTLVGNLVQYGRGSLKDGMLDFPDPMAGAIYKGVLSEVVAILNGWSYNNLALAILTGMVPGKTAALATLMKDEQMSLPRWKAEAQKESLVGVKGTTTKIPVIETNGRGMHLGNNSTDRKWTPDATLNDLMNERNNKNFLDIGGRMETKASKLEAATLEVKDLVQDTDFSLKWE